MSKRQSGEKNPSHHFEGDCAHIYAKCDRFVRWHCAIQSTFAKFCFLHIFTFLSHIIHTHGRHMRAHLMTHYQQRSTLYIIIDHALGTSLKRKKKTEYLLWRHALGHHKWRSMQYIFIWPDSVSNLSSCSLFAQAFIVVVVFVVLLFHLNRK